MSNVYKVKSAVYGGVDNKLPNMSKAADVSAVLQQHLDNEHVKLCISNGVPSPNPGLDPYPPFNDPAVGYGKGFAAVVEINNVEHYFACAEGGTIDFSEFPEKPSDQSSTKSSFRITKVKAIFSDRIIQPLIYFVDKNSLDVTGTIIGSDIQTIVPMNIEENLPVLRVFTGDGSYSITPDFNGGEYYVFAGGDGETSRLWSGATPNQDFMLTVDCTKKGLKAFSLTDA